MPAEILNNKEISRVITRMAHEMLERNKGSKNLCLVGIHRGGVYLASRLADKIGDIEGERPPMGTLDITLYRDDISLREDPPVIKETNIPFSLNNMKVVLVDDVLFTGRTIRAAMDAVIDFGRPARIQVAALIDRGHRELPIKADYVGKNISTARKESVKVYYAEEKQIDLVLLLKEGEQPGGGDLIE